jgi:type IV pilus assembly protein PilW
MNTLANQREQQIASGLPIREESGFSLIELMLALMLGLIVIGGLGQIYVGGRDTNRIIDNTTLLNDNGRVAMELLARDARLAGFFSCGGGKAKFANALNRETFWLKLEGLEGFKIGDDEATADTLPEAFDDFPTPLAGTDVFVVRYADPRSRIVVGNDDLDLGNRRFVFDNAHFFRIGDVAVLNDDACGQTSVFQVTGGSNSDGSFIISYDNNEQVLPGNCTTKLAGEYNCNAGDRTLTERNPLDGFARARISKLVSRAFFVANAGSSQCPTAPAACTALKDCPTLFAVGSENLTPVPVLHDVTVFQITYGVDDSAEEGASNSGAGSVTKYLTANDVTDDDLWPRVVSMKITLGLVTRVPPSHDYDVDPCKPKKFTTTVALRNSGAVVAH